MLRLKQVRKEQKLTLKALAARTGLSLKLLSKYELGTVDPPSSKLFGIAVALGVPIGALYQDEDASAAHNGALSNGQEQPHA